MDAAQQFVQVGSLVERVHDLGDHLTFRLHAVKFSNVLKANHNAFDSGHLGIIVCRPIEPAPASIFALHTAAATKRPSSGSGEIAKTFTNSPSIICMDEAPNGFSDEVLGRVAEYARKTGICREDDPLWRENSYEFPGGIQQSEELLLATCAAERECGTLRHLATTRDTSLRKRAPRARVSPASSVWVLF